MFFFPAQSQSSKTRSRFVFTFTKCTYKPVARHICLGCSQRRKKLKLKKTRGVWNWSVKTLSPGALSLVLDFSSLEFFIARFDFFAPPLTAPESPRMDQVLIKGGPIHKSACGHAPTSLCKSAKTQLFDTRL